MVECAALEMRYTGNRIEGSNPSLSASHLLPEPNGTAVRWQATGPEAEPLPEGIRRRRRGDTLFEFDYNAGEVRFER